MNTKTIMANRHNLFLYINEMPIAHWFMEQFGIGDKNNGEKSVFKYSRSEKSLSNNDNLSLC